MSILAVVRRNDRGSITLNMAELDVVIGSIIDVCRTEKEVEWLQEQLIGCVESMAESKIEELEENPEALQGEDTQ